MRSGLAIVNGDLARAKVDTHLPKLEGLLQKAVIVLTGVLAYSVLNIDSLRERNS